MTPQLDKAMRQGGMSRRGFLRAMGVTATAVLVPGIGPRSALLVPTFEVVTMPSFSYRVTLEHQDGRITNKMLSMVEPFPMLSPDIIGLTIHAKLVNPRPPSPSPSYYTPTGWRRIRRVIAVQAKGKGKAHEQR